MNPSHVKITFKFDDKYPPSFDRGGLTGLEGLDKTKCEGNMSYTSTELDELQRVVPFKRKLDFTNDRRLTYRTNKDNILRLTVHHGQRKLLLTEIEFLTLHGNLSRNVVYAGAAPGIKTRFLSTLFPEHKFHLYDPNPFGIKETEHIKIYNQYFTDATAKELGDKFSGDCLFISDIRRTPDNPDDFEDYVYDDLQMQQRWIQLMNVKMSMLKFRLPFNRSEITYADGEIRYQPWAPLSSTETRLYTDGKKQRTYKMKDYEDIMYRFNMCTRPQIFEESSEITSSDIEGFDNCYDCTAEYMIIKNYLKENDQPHKKSDIIAMINKISKHTRQKLKRMCHGLATRAPTLDRLQQVHKDISI